MASPRSLTYALYQHWDVIERLVVMGRDIPAYEQDQVLKVIQSCQPQKSREDAEAVMRQMAGAELLQVLPRTTALQINPLVLEFVRGLTREHELGLSDVLKARISGIKDATQALTDAIEGRDSDALRHAATQLADLFRHINMQLDQDRHAILELAERAKSRDANLPIARRYAEVLEAYDRYVAPMTEMMDSGPSGTFYRHLEAAEHALDNVFERLTTQGAIYTQRLAVRHVAFQAKELRRMGREVLKQCTDTLLPLREELRQHNALSAAIVLLLGRVRKRGLNSTLPATALPLWRRDVSRRINVGSEVKSIMAEALRYEPCIVPFPEDEGGHENLVVDQVNDEALAETLARSMPVNDLLVWLKQHNPEWRDDTILNLYHKLLDRPEWSVAYSPEEAYLALNEVGVRYFPHGIHLPQHENDNL